MFDPACATVLKFVEIYWPFMYTLKSSCPIAANPAGGEANVLLLNVATGLVIEFAIAVVFNPTYAISAAVIPAAPVPVLVCAPVKAVS